jgi:GTPase SAR1 family protein
LVFDITDKESFEGISYWMENMGLNTDINKLSIILVGNKCDLENQRKILRKDAEVLAANFSIPYYETSAKSSQNINEIYTELSKKII